MNFRMVFATLFITAVCASGCSAATANSTSAADTSTAGISGMQASSAVSVGHYLTVSNTNTDLELRDNNESLAPQGLYYATWSIGEAQEYVNSDEDTVDLYDAHLYMLLGEASSSDSASENLLTWLNAARDNYEITGESEQQIGDINYTIIEYDCVSEDTPYAQGISAFGLYEDCAICAELQCQDSYEEDLTAILTNFLQDCTFRQ